MGRIKLFWWAELSKGNKHKLYLLLCFKHKKFVMQLAGKDSILFHESFLPGSDKKNLDTGHCMGTQKFLPLGQASDRHAYNPA